jgi:hypothetical protein
MSTRLVTEGFYRKGTIGVFVGVASEIGGSGDAFLLEVAIGRILDDVGLEVTAKRGGGGNAEDGEGSYDGCFHGLIRYYVVLVDCGDVVAIAMV